MNKFEEEHKKLIAKHLDLTGLTFSIFTAKETRKLSVLKICTPLTFNELGHSLAGGLYDPVLGALSDRSEPCKTCGVPGGNYNCYGHMGHIELPVPVVNPLFQKIVCSLIKLSCLKCFTLQIPRREKLVLAAKFLLFKEDHANAVDDLDQEISSLVPDRHQLNEGEAEYVREAIKNYLAAIREKTQTKSDDTEPNSQPSRKFGTKNFNLQWHCHIETALKQFSPGKNCMDCMEKIPKVTVLKNKIMMASQVQDESESIVQRTETIVFLPDQLRTYLRNIWQNDADILTVMAPALGEIEEEYPTDVFFFEVIPVLPPLVRPLSYVDGRISEHPQTQVYKIILQDCLILRNIIQGIKDASLLPDEGRLVVEGIRGKTSMEKLHNAWEALQNSVNHLMDRDMSKTTESGNCQGLKQVIEKKEGILRMHMMGKRVNFAARSVITPDPNINIDEIGVPDAFAIKLSYPVAVTPWNVAELRQLIINGPDVHPGAVMIEDENGKVQKITPTCRVAREALAKRLFTVNMDGKKVNNRFHGVKIVYRHLQNGDILLLNRQPTLHRPSIMAHKARILKGEKTLRLHYSNCKAYNADFDGDEMNAHFPQSEMGRSEGYNIVNVSNHYLVPKDGTPLGGLIQDHVISGVKLSTRGKFFSKADYLLLVYSGLADHRGDIILLPPAIIKPVMLWSGKQVISTVIINTIPKGRALINLPREFTGAKISVKEWQVTKPRTWKCGEPFTNPKTMSEAEVIIRNGELLSGVLDKTHYGATSYGFVHCVYELYGGTCSSKLLSSFGKLFQSHLQRIGFTLGISDILILAKDDNKRQKIIAECRKIGESVQQAVLELPEDTEREVVVAKMEENHFKNKKFRAMVDRKYKTALDPFTNDINKVCLPAGLLKKFPDNNLQLMVQSGAKGSTVNTMQISCLLGQIELEGKRPPLMLSGRSLPSFPAYDPTPRAGGFIDGRFMTAIEPQECFFHCMAGREGLIDTAVKTSRSGYLQRCLIKHLEGLTVNYDSTVRDSDGSLVQMYYGEDGLDIASSRFLRKEQIEFLVENKNAIVDQALLKSLKDAGDFKKVIKTAKKIKKWKIKHGDCFAKRRTGQFLTFSQEHSKKDSRKRQSVDPSCERSRAATSLMRKWHKCDRTALPKPDDKCPDPLITKYRQDLEFGVLSERIEGLIDEYLCKKEHNFTTTINKDELRDLMCYKIMKTLSPPGDPVGLLAAQSIGEPSTQMTLNTFHFAGRGDMNVTLGIPRLREILMMASKNIKTPSMEIPLRKDLAYPTGQADKLRLKLTKCMFADVLKHVKIDRKMTQNPQRRLEYTLLIEFLPYKAYKREFIVQPRTILEKTEMLFFKELFREIKKMGKVAGTLLRIEDEKAANTRAENTMLDEDADDVEPKSAQKSAVKQDLGEMHESSDEEEAADDADATVARTAARHQENREYDDPEEEEVDRDQPSNDIDESEETTEKPPAEMDDEDDDDAPEIKFIDKMQADQRKKNVAAMFSHGIEYDFDEEHFRWCKYQFSLPLKAIKLDMPTIVRNTANKVILWETPAIKRAFTFQNNRGDTILKTDGLNIVEMFKYNKILDLHKLYSNDIYGISQTYGIEAANRVIIREVKDVFNMYGITVDPRHLSLIADYMTFDGRYQPLSRKGMEDSASPLQQMSFESSLTFLKNATLQGKRDDLESPSSRLMVGQPCRSGTGAFDIVAAPMLKTKVEPCS